jgi:transcriptional regulator with GAF, ATPase, and Fis domain
MSMAVEESEFFREATLHICGNLDIEKAMVQFLRYLQKFMPADRLILELFDEELGSVRTVVHATPEDGTRGYFLVPLSEEAKKHIKQKYRQGVPYYENNPSEYSPARELLAFHKQEASAFIELPLVTSDSQPGGVVLLAESGQYNDSQLQLMSLLKAPFQVAMANALQHAEIVRLKDVLADDNKFLHRELSRITGGSIVGAKFGLREVMHKVQHIAPLDTPVLLIGETGVGKDLIATAIHDSSPRSLGPFIPVNCGAIAESLLDSELFGHEKGAFTGAVSQKRGRFERADKGTIFLDEVAELTPSAQVKLLRVLQNGEIDRVGGIQTITLDIRVIAATNRDLESMVARGTFRDDLWYRLNVFPIEIPPLRERRIDIPALVQHFIALKSKELRLPDVPTFAPGALERLQEYWWPGNVRELANVVERGLILSHGKTIDFSYMDAKLHATTKASSEQQEKPEDLDATIAKHIRNVLAKTGGRIHGPGGAADLLGINPSTLRSRMNRLGIEYGKRSR